ncbi:MAG: TRAP transporter substrate-binding protein DctP [Gammaproteobacteria bacterium]|nr:TRAP transporter substrate-binding protein DctP [Gammaproteobacteria bacterium]
MKTRRLLLACLTILFLSTSVASARVFKIATVAPEGTFWMQEMRAAAEQIEQETAGRVKFKFYPGGVMGSDESVLRKIRIGQLHGGAVTAASMTGIAPDIGIYELPYLFDSLEQVDYVRSKMDAELIAGLDRKGFVGFGFAEGGFSYMMSDEPLQSVAEVRTKKVWLPSNHEIGEAVFSSADVASVSLPLSDVLTALQTGLIDTIITSPIGAIALQWHTKIAYVVEEPLTYFGALLVINKKAFNKLSEADRQIARDIMGQAFISIDKKNRKDNVEAKQALKNQGIKFVSLSAASRKEWHEVGDKAIKVLEQQNQYSDKVYEDLMRYVAEAK